MNSLEWRGRECLREVLRHQRRDYVGFSICIVLLTPALLVGAIMIFVLMGPLGDARQASWLSGPQAALYGLGVLLGGMLVALLVRGRSFSTIRSGFRMTSTVATSPWGSPWRFRT